MPAKSGQNNKHMQQFKCQFCEVDDYGYKECLVKVPRINCSIDKHPSSKCCWTDQTCSRCGATGQASKLHQVVDLGFGSK